MALYVTKTMSSIVSEALLLLNKIDAQDEPDATDMARGCRTLQMMLEEWQTEAGLELWIQRRGEIFLSEGITDYDMSDTGDDVIELTHISLVDADAEAETDEESELTVSIISRQDYLEQPNKFVQGQPNMVWFHFDEDDTATLTFWPTPDDDYRAKVSYKARFTNATVTTTEIQIPRYWLKAVIYGLADDLATAFGSVETVRGQKINAKAREYYDKAAAFDNIQQGGGEIRFVPGR